MAHDIVFKVGKTGEEVKTFNYEVKIKTESARVEFTNFRTYFSGQEDYFKLGEVYSLTQGVKTATLVNEIKINESQAAKNAITDRKQVNIPIKNINLGSTVHISYSVVSPPIIRGQYMNSLDLSYSDLEPIDTLTFDFDLPVNYSVYNLKENFNLIESANPSGGQVLKLTRKQTPLNSRMTSSLYISSIKEWGSINRLLAKRYKDVWSGPLAPELQKIADDAKKLKTLREQINYASAKINELMAYSGTWIDTKSKFLPQGFENALKTRRGDCKDFSTMLTAILNNISVKAFPAFIIRSVYTSVGTESFIARSKLPSLTTFDHVMVWVQDPSGKVLWVDPTSPYVDAQFIPADLLGKFALVLDGVGNQVTFLPQQNTVPYEVNVEQKIKINGSLIEAEGAVYLHDLSQYQFEMQTRQEGIESVQKMMNGYINYQNKLPLVMNKVVEGNTVKYPFGYALENMIIEKPGTFKMLSVPNFAVPLSGLFLKSQPMLLEEPGTLKIKTEILNASSVDSWRGECTGKSKWLNFSRTIDNVKGNIVVVDSFKFKKRMLSPVDINDQFYINNAIDLMNCKGKELVMLNFNKAEPEMKKQADFLGPDIDKMTPIDAVNLYKGLSRSPYRELLENKLLSYTQKMIETNPNDVSSLFLRSSMFMRRSFTKEDAEPIADYLTEGLDLLERAEKLGKSAYASQITIGKFDFYLKMKEFDKANAALKEIQVHAPALGFELSVDYFLASHQYSAAEKIILENLAKGNRNAYAEKKLIKVYKLQNKYAALLDYIPKYVVKNPSDTTVMTDL
ncbi:MAG: DUF3857 domain-containing protein, partial [Pseudobdellovibrio sp.]